MTDTNTEETSVPGVYVTGDVSRDVLVVAAAIAARRAGGGCHQQGVLAPRRIATAEMLAHYLLPGFGSQCSTPPRVRVFPGADPRRHPRPKGCNIMAFQRARKLGADQMRHI